MMLLVAITFVACEKDSPANEVPVEPENPNEMPVERMEWEIPAKLPENIVDIMVNAPCWKYYHIACSGEVIDGKAVIENVAWQRLDGDEAKNLSNSIRQWSMISIGITVFPIILKLHSTSVANGVQPRYWRIMVTE